MQSSQSCNNSRALLLFSSHPDKEVIRKGLRSRAESRKIYHNVLLHLLSAAGHAAQELDFDIIVASDSGDNENLDRVFRALPTKQSYRFIEHKKSRFGEKLTDALEQVKDWGYQKVVLIGNDCIDIAAPTLCDTFRRLDKNETVIGPATDGGFYLLGLSAISTKVLTGIPWCTAGVMKHLLDNLERVDCQTSFLPTRADFDSFKVLKKILAAITSRRLKCFFANLLLILQTKIPHHSGIRYNVHQWQVLPERWQLPPPPWCIFLSPVN